MCGIDAWGRWGDWVIGVFRGDRMAVFGRAYLGQIALGYGDVGPMAQRRMADIGFGAS